MNNVCWVHCGAREFVVSPRNLHGRKGVWIFLGDDPRELGWEHQIPDEYRKTDEFIYYTNRGDSGGQYDILAGETRNVLCVGSRSNTGGIHDVMLPVRLESPSPWLETLRLVNMSVTGDFIEAAAASPNLRKFMIINTHLEDTVTMFPTPVNTENLETWAFMNDAVLRHEDWGSMSYDDFPSLEFLLLRGRGCYLFQILSRTLGGSANRTFGNLKCLDLADNGITTDNVEGWLKRGYSDSSKLVYLNLSHNEMEAIPLMYGDGTKKICWHNPRAVFKAGSCGCPPRGYEDKDLLLQVDYPERLFWDLDGDMNTPAELKVAAAAEGVLTVELECNPLDNMFYPELEGRGMEMSGGNEYMGFDLP